MVGKTEMSFPLAVKSVWQMAMTWANWAFNWMSGRWTDKQVLIRVGLVVVEMAVEAACGPNMEDTVNPFAFMVVLTAG